MKSFFRTAAIACAASFAGALMLGSEAARAQGSGEAARNRAAVAAGFQAWADGTGSPYNLLARNVRWTITGNSLAGKTYTSKEAFMSEVIRPFNARMRERLIPAVHALYVDGDTVIVHFDARGMALDGKPYVNSYAWFLRMKGGEIIEAYAFFDALSFDDLWTRVMPAESH